MFRIEKNMTIGRAQECDVTLDDEGVSRQHAQIEHSAGMINIVDLDSTNGIYFNGDRFNRRQLNDGDKVQFGSATILKFSYQDSLEEAFLQNQYDAATKDGLTGIYNKKFFHEKLGAEFSYVLRHNEVTSLIMFDIDHFKKTNDLYGHLAGDQVLRELTQLVSEALRTEDLFARVGGEEFAILLRNTTEKRANVLAARIRRAVEVRDFFWEGVEVPVTISLGVATAVDGMYQKPNQFIRAADRFLYQAKEGGRNRVVCSLRGA